MVWHQGIHDRMGMQRMRREGVEVTPGLVPWRGEGRSGTGVFAFVQAARTMPVYITLSRCSSGLLPRTSFHHLQALQLHSCPRWRESRGAIADAEGRAPLPLARRTSSPLLRVSAVCPGALAPRERPPLVQRVCAKRCGRGAGRGGAHVFFPRALPHAGPRIRSPARRKGVGADGCARLLPCPAPWYCRVVCLRWREAGS